MKDNTDKSLKSQNMKWLVGLASLDVLVVLLFVVPETVNMASMSQLAIARGLATSVMPVVVLLLIGVLPHDVKSMLVYWKARGVVPGCEAFTKYGPADVRIDMVTLKRNVGALPTEPAEQNSKWYKLYKMVGNEPEVAEAHKLFLMYRDMATMSLPLIALLPLVLYFVGASTSALWITAGVFFVQFLMTALGARWSGVRFVCNVLAIHSAKKVTATKAL